MERWDFTQESHRKAFAAQFGLNHHEVERAMEELNMKKISRLGYALRDCAAALSAVADSLSKFAIAIKQSRKPNRGIVRRDKR
jgi:hypothetical protein